MKGFAKTEPTHPVPVTLLHVMVNGSGFCMRCGAGSPSFEGPCDPPSTPPRHVMSRFRQFMRTMQPGEHCGEMTGGHGPSNSAQDSLRQSVDPYCPAST